MRKFFNNLLDLFVAVVVITLVALAIDSGHHKKPCDCGDICSKSPTGYSCGLKECPGARR